MVVVFPPLYIVVPSAIGKYDRLHFVVKDTGRGISDELAKILFQPFTQGDASFSRKTGKELFPFFCVYFIWVC